MASHLATAGGYNTPRDMQDRVRRESSTSKRAKMGPGPALELKFQNPFKGRPESVTHSIRRAPRRPGQTHQVDIYVTHGLSRVKEPSGAPSTTKTTTKKHQELDPLWPPWTRQLSEWRPTRPPGNQPHDNGRHPSSAGSDRFSRRGLASEAARSLRTREEPENRWTNTDDERMRMDQPAPTPSCRCPASQAWNQTIRGEENDTV